MSRLAAALSLTLALGFACKDLTPLTPQAQLNLCRANALAPLVGSVEDAIQTVRDVNAGRIDIVDVLVEAHATKEQVAALVKALSACDIAPAAPSAETVPEGEVL
jgi:hypothetical protein